MNQIARLSLVDRADAELSIVVQCRLLKVAGSSLYWRAVAVSEDDLRLMRQIDELYLARPFYDARRMVAVLRRDGWTVNRKRVRRLMRVMRIEAIYQKPNTSRRHPDHVVYPYLLRGLAMDRSNQVWCADITYVLLANGFAYLVAVMDWFSRRVLAWRLSTGMDTGFCVEALQEALDRHGSPEIFQFRSGRAVHQHRVHRRAGGKRCPHQHGWQRSLPRQHLHRAAVAQPEVRGHLHQGLRFGPGGAPWHRRLAGLLQ